MKATLELTPKSVCEKKATTINNAQTRPAKGSHRAKENGMHDEHLTPTVQTVQRLQRKRKFRSVTLG